MQQFEPGVTYTEDQVPECYRYRFDIVEENNGSEEPEEIGSSEKLNEDLQGLEKPVDTEEKQKVKKPFYKEFMK